MLKFKALKLLFILIFQVFLLDFAFANGASRGGGGGTGIAIYKPNQPKSVENLVRVESLALYKARRNGLYPVTKDSDPLEKQLFYFPFQYLTKSQQYKSEEQIEFLMHKVHSMLGKVSPAFAAQFLLADQLFSKIKVRSETTYKAASEKFNHQQLLPSVQINIIEDFGEYPQLDENEQLVQIIKRVKQDFVIDIALWNKMELSDQLDLRIHEDAYAISGHNNSAGIQKFQIYILNHLRTNESINRQEFEQLAETEWGLIQINHSEVNIDINNWKVLLPGKKGIDQSYYESSGHNTSHGGLLLPGFPLSSRENLICGVLDESKNSENGKITLIYLDPTADHTEQIEVEIDKESDLGNLKMKAEKYLQAKMNPLFSPYTEKYPPLYCFEKKGFSPLRLLNPSHGLSLRYVEFRRSINTKEINESIQNANDQYEYGHLVSYFILNKIDAEVESFDKAQEKVKYKEIFNRSQNFRQEMTKKIKALHLEKFVESHLLFRLNSGLDRILQYI